MRNRAYLLVALLGLLTFALVPGIAAAGQGKNLSEIALASDAAARAAAVSGPVISVSPLGNDYGVINVGSSSSFDFTVSNTGDADLHISGASSTSGSFTVSFGSLTVAPSGSTSMSVTYAPSMGVNESAMITVNSDASNGAFTVNVSGQGNRPPTLAPIGDKSASAFVNLNFFTPATDDDDQVNDVVTYSVSPALPPGATYDSNTGEFNWTPMASDAGTHTLTFCADEGLASDCETITITVTAGNSPPVADAGGPYSGGTNQSIQFNGTGSSDPDGNNLSYSWDFGDGGTGSGATPTHVYTVPGNYIVTLTVTDDGSPVLSDDDVASAQVLNTVAAQVTAKLGPNSTMRISGGGAQKMGLETSTRPATDIDPTTIRMSTTYPGAGTATEIAPDIKTAQIGDIDNDGISEMTFAFTRDQLRQLLGNVPSGTMVQLDVTARTTVATGSIPVQGSITVRTKGSGTASAVSAFASPNPFNPETAISVSLKNNGPVSVRIYSIDGRLVKTLKNEFATAGTHEVRWNGTDNNGRSVPSGMYFVKTESGADKSVFKLSLLK
jgi:PKD repeat protein